MPTPWMNLTLPVPTQTPGPAWAAALTAALNRIDSHDHTLNNGVPLSNFGSITGVLPVTTSLSGVIYATNFGVVADGVTDNIPFFSATFAYIPASTSGAFIHLPRSPGGSKTIRVKSPLVIPNNVVLKGEFRTVIERDPAFSPSSMPTVVVSGFGAGLHDLTVAGQFPVAGNADGIVIVNETAQLRNVSTFFNGRDGVRVGWYNGCGVGQTAGGAEQWHFDHVVSNFNGRHGIMIDSREQSTPPASGAGSAYGTLTPSNGQTDATGSGIVINYGQSCHFFGGDSEGNAGFGINFAPDVTSTFYMNCSVEGMYLQSVNVAASASGVFLRVDDLTPLTISPSATAVAVVSPSSMSLGLVSGTTGTFGNAMITGSALFFSGSIGFIASTSSNGRIAILGNRDSNSNGTDVVIQSSVSRSAGFLLNVGLGAPPFTAMQTLTYDGTASFTAMARSPVISGSMVKLDQVLRLTDFANPTPTNNDLWLSGTNLLVRVTGSTFKVNLSTYP